MILYKRNKFRLLMLFIALLIPVIIFGGCSKKTPKVYRVGIMFGLKQLYPSIDGFKERMAELGYIEGKNITYDIYKTHVELDKDRQILNKFVADKVDLIFLAPTETALIAKEITKGTNIPTVFSGVVIEGNNLVESVRRPGGNITGVRLPGTEYTAKRLEILHEIMPHAKRIWVTYEPTNPNNPPTLKVLRLTCQSLGIELVEVPVTSVAEIQADLERRAKSADIGMDAIMIIPDWLSLSDGGLALIEKFSMEHKIPVVPPSALVSSATTSQYPHNLIFSYTADFTESGGLAAVIADKVFKGIPVDTIPVVTPEAGLKINYKVTQELGLEVPNGLLVRADEIIR